jgi:hypothetical protein
MDSGKKRKIEGDFPTVFKELVDYKTNFHAYLRTPQYSFNVLHNMKDQSVCKLFFFTRKIFVFSFQVCYAISV